MSNHKIRIYYGAPAYQDEPEGRARKKELEEKFGLPGEEASVGMGADLPALVFVIDIGEIVVKYGLMAWGALTLGQDITERVAFYVEAAKRIARYLKGHHTYLERDAAFILAVNAIVEHLGKAPKSIVLEGYMIGDWAGGGWDETVEVSGMGEPPPHPGAWVPHHFQFKIDRKKRIKAIVDTDGVKVFELPSPKRKLVKKKAKATSNKTPRKTSGGAKLQRKRRRA
jgi:hypothetical protein